MNKTRIMTLTIIAILFSSIVSQNSFAKSSLTPDDEAMFSQNNILFYEPCSTQDGNGSSSEICGSNKNYAGVQVFTDSQMNAIKHFQPFYEKSAAKYGLPWELLAVLHYREHSLTKSNPDNGQGVYQLYSYTNGGKNANAFWPAGAISDDEFQRQTDIVARLISEGYGKGKNLNTDDGIKQTLFAFNGVGDGVVFETKAKALGFTNPLEGSAYVMNKYDEQRDPSSPNVNPAWVGNYTSDGNWSAGAKDERWGTFTAYKALTCDGNSGASNDADDEDTNSNDSSDEYSSSDNSTIGSNAKAISDAAAKLAWPKSYGEDYYKGKSGEKRWPDFAEAVEELGLKGHGHTEVPDCGDFVETVVKYTGYDKNFVQKLSYLKKKTKLWDIVDWDGKDVSKLRAGDILYSNKSGNGNLEGHDSSGQHWWIITEIDGQLYTAEASLSAQTWGRIKKKVNKDYKPYKGKAYWIIRAKDDDSTKPSCDAKVEGSKNINATGVALAWPLGTDKDKYTLASGKVLESVLSSPGVTDTFSGTGSGTALFQEAWIKSRMSKNSMINNLNDGRYSWRYGAYCCGFTAVVARYSGYDTHFDGSLSIGKYEQVDYAKEHPDLWDVETWDGQKSSLQGGDILVSRTHSWMVVEDESGELYRAEASLNSYEFGHISKYSSSASGKTYIIRAKNANNSNVGVSVTDGVKSSSTSGIVTSSVQNSHDIGAVARYFAWPLGTEKSKYAHYPKEKEAWKTLLKNNGFTNFGQTNMGHDCGVFVSGVLRYAGLTNSMGKQGTPIIPDEVDNGENGWYKVDTDGTKESDLQDGDVIYYYHDSGHTDLYHFAIFLRDENGKPLLAEAGHDTKYGLITEFSTHGYMSVFRNRNNKTGSGSSSNNNECSLCPTDDDSSGNNSGDGTIVEGGFKTKEEAQKIADAYNKANLSSIAGMGSACGGNYHLNCVNFSKWFIHTYLKGMDIGFTGNGGDIADNFYKANKGKFPNLKESNVPVAYSIFSVRQTPGLSSSNEGHTGVILGINGGQVIFAEAAWCKFTGQVRTLPISSFTSGQYHKFIDVNAYINGGI